MVRGFILYYLNIKPTHGYEIQKYLQIAGTDTWAKIQSGSIYYALTKLEKEKHIEVLREERTGSRIRKIYQITDSGRKELHKEMKEQLAAPIISTGSTKFITDPILNTLTKEECYKIIEHHIKELKEQKAYWEKWQNIKAKDISIELTKLSFKMTINSLISQIEWHEELLRNLDSYINYSEYTKNFIKSFDFDKMDPDNKETEEVNERIDYLQNLKEIILKDPRNAIENLDKIMEELRVSKQNK